MLEVIHWQSERALLPAPQGDGCLRMHRYRIDDPIRSDEISQNQALLAWEVASHLQMSIQHQNKVLNISHIASLLMYNSMHHQANNECMIQRPQSLP